MGESFQPPLASQEERIAYNEAWTRSLNQQRAEWMAGTGRVDGFRCECWRTACESRIELSSEEWTEVRSHGNWFAVAPRHVADDIEVVVKELPGYWLIAKYGEAGTAAEELA
jgi:hypothetical protein